MISMIWISQAVLRAAETDLFATILFSLILMWILMSFKGDEERGVTGLFQYLIAGFLYLCTSNKFWNKNTLPQDERTTVNPKKENKKSKETPPPVLVENPKKKQKKGKRSSRKNFCKENLETTMAKKETKVFTSWNICEELNRDKKSIYDELYKLILTEIQLRMNKFPHQGFQPQTQVAVDDSNRTCSRCAQHFLIIGESDIAETLCTYHPRKKATVSLPGGMKIHGCCNQPEGSVPCAVANHHVTLQHRPRALTKTSSRRHIKKGLQYGVFSLDCEMVYTTNGLEVARVTLVNMDGLAEYDGYVKPKSRVLDYNTRFSGVEPGHLRNVEVTLEVVKDILSSKIHEDTILVGHALNNDLAALGIIHNTVVDTSVLYGDSWNPFMKTALRTLAAKHLGVTIQSSDSGHDSIEDARACMRLALLKVPAAKQRSQPAAIPQVPAAVPTQQSTRQLAASTSHQPEQQLPLVEIQNFDYRYQSNLDQLYQRVPPAVWNCKRPLWYNPEMGCYTPFLRG